MLNEIVDSKRKELEEIKTLVSKESLVKKIEKTPEARDFKGALKKRGEKDTVRIIAEIKKASPSYGKFTSNFLQKNSPGSIAAIYEESGASAISVLTDNKYFSGLPKYLLEAKKNTRIPILRKDFIFDEYQIYESKIMGADAILLIVSILPVEKLKSFIKLISALKMNALVEVRDSEEVKKASDAGAEIIGINNRNLTTMKVDINKTPELAGFINPDVILVSESGINRREQVMMLEDKAGIDAILVGTALVTNEDPRRKIRELKGEF